MNLGDRGSCSDADLVSINGTSLITVSPLAVLVFPSIKWPQYHKTSPEGSKEPDILDFKFQIKLSTLLLNLQPTSFSSSVKSDSAILKKTQMLSLSTQLGNILNILKIITRKTRKEYTNTKITRRKG